MPEIEDVVKYLIVGLLLVLLGVSVGYTISDVFELPYRTVVPVCVTIMLSIGIPMISHGSDGNSAIPKDTNSIENGEESNKDSTEEKEKGEPDTSADADATSDSQIDEDTLEMGRQKRSKYSVGKSNEEILEEQVERISDLFTVLEGDIIRINDKYEPDPYRKMLLYVIAARYSFSEGYRESPAVSSKELRSYFNYDLIDIDIFIRRLPSALDPNTGTFPDYDKLDSFSFNVEISNLERAIDWVSDDDEPMGLDVRLDFGFAKMCLENAREYCKEIEEIEQERIHSCSSNKYSSIEYEIKESIHDVRDYPIFNEDDTVWRDFIRTADTALRKVQQNSPSGILHCVDRMDGRLDVLRSRYENSVENHSH